MEFPVYQVDAFASRVFAGNPAVVCCLDGWLDAVEEFLVAHGVGEVGEWFGDG